VIWSVEPAVVRVATGVCLQLLRRVDPELADRVGDSAPSFPPGPASDRQLRLAAAIATRTLGRIG